MSIKTTNRRVVKEVPWGVYVWKLPSGEYLADGDGNFLLVYCMEGNQASINAITQAARGFGFQEGEAVWWSGKRPITDSEYEQQLARAEAGLTPDPFDVAAIKEEARNLHLNGNG